MDIDLVYMWVDGSDPVWLAKKTACMPDDKKPLRADVAGKCRFVNNDELRYSLRSAEKFAPWIRRIYIVTDGQCPAWLDTSNPRIRVVDHREILPPEVLPTFNSTAIEWGLPNIPGLSEHFLLGNDDMLFGAPVLPEFFFAADGAPYVRLKHKSLKRHLDNIYTHLLYQSQCRIAERFGKHYAGAPHHNIDAYRRSDFLSCIEAFRFDVERTLHSRFRQFEDIHRSVISYYALAQHRAHEVVVRRWGSTLNPFKIAAALLGGKSRVDSRYFPARHPDHKALYARYSPSLFCLNDDEWTTDDDRLRIRRFLEELFPEKSEFEK